MDPTARYEPPPALVGAAAAVVFATGLLVVALRVGDDVSAVRPVGAGCGAVVERTPGSVAHRFGRIGYDAVPPDSGPHNTSPLRPVPRFVPPEADPLVVERAVHNLEHGYVVVWYDPAAGAALDDLRDELAGVRAPKVLAVPWDRGGLATPFVLTAWGYAQPCAGVPTAEVVDAFYAGHGGENGEAPEKRVPF